MKLRDIAYILILTILVPNIVKADESDDFQVKRKEVMVYFDEVNSKTNRERLETDGANRLCEKLNQKTLGESKLLSEQLLVTSSELKKNQAEVAALKQEKKSLIKENKELKEVNQNLVQKNDDFLLVLKENDFWKNKVSEMESRDSGKNPEQRNIISLIGSYGPTGTVETKNSNNLVYASSSKGITGGLQYQRKLKQNIWGLFGIKNNGELNIGAGYSF